jgi:hypothetical protein
MTFTRLPSTTRVNPRSAIDAYLLPRISDDTIGSSVTEKTFDPLIKGHFILPFGTYKFIENTKLHYGFEFPNFIDYSYDLIEDDAQRYYAYSREVERLLTIPIDTWREHWNNYNILRTANQQIFFDRPYHRIDLSQVDSL